MHCTCTDGCYRCGNEPVMRQVYNCPGSQRVIKHQHIVKHKHDTINEYDVIHEHEYNTRDVVREREVVKHNDYCPHTPNYCGDECCDYSYNNCCDYSYNCNPCHNHCHGIMPFRGRGYFGRRW